MQNISNQFNILYEPVKALLIYGQKGGKQENTSVYVESYDIATNGKPINAHPLSLSEGIALAELLQSSAELQNGFLRSKGLLPENVLYVNPDNNGFAIWYTPPQKQNLLFIESLGIPSGQAHLPGMVWKAGRNNLSVFAYAGKNKPNSNTALCHAPFFNTHPNASVCMGNVRINIERKTCLEDFIRLWEQYFFGSYFSHTIANGSNIKGNIVQLWQAQMESQAKFPENVLVKCNLNVSQIIR
jgi:PRTRC genetic system protein B